MTMRPSVPVGLVCLIASLSACGGGEASGPGVKPVATVTVTPGADTVIAADSVLVTATLTDADGVVLTGRPVTWTSSDPAIATVGPGGWVRGTGLGAASILAEAEGRSASAAITVVPVVSVEPSLPSLFAGDTLHLRTVLLDARGDTLTGTPVVSWTAGAPGTASVSSAGVVSGTAPGTTTITATVDGQPGVVDVVVLPIPVRVNREIGYARSDCQSIPCTEELRVIRPDNLQDVSLGPPLCFLHQTAWSPDGSRLAVVLLGCQQLGQPRSGIWVRDSAGTVDIELHGSGLLPTWAPDGSRVAFMVSVGGDHELFSNSVTGTDLQRLTNDATAHDGQPEWSPDGRQIVWRKSSFTVDEIWLMRADGSNRRLLVRSTTALIDPRWSPDGKWVAYAGTAGLSVVPSGGGAPFLVEPSSFNHRWMPDARSLVYNRATSPPSDAYDIVIRDRDGSGRRVISTLGTCYSDLSVSPDGQWLAYVCPDAAQAQPWPSLFVVPSAGGTPVALTAGVNAGHVHWRP